MQDEELTARDAASALTALQRRVEELEGGYQEAIEKWASARNRADAAERQAKDYREALERVLTDQALGSAEAPTGLRPSGCDPSRWQPIETAPKDEDAIEVLTYTPVENHRIGVICGVHVGFWSWSLQEWRQSDLEWEIDPSFWMPIPRPPASVIEARSDETGTAPLSPPSSHKGQNP